MDDDDWDIQAVVKGCAAATTNPSFSFADQINSFDFLTDDDDQNNIINDVVGPLFPGLQEAYGDLCVDPSATPAASFTGRADPARDEIMQIPKPAVQENIRFGCSNGIGSSSSSSSPSHNLQAQYNIRQRRRKNQQMKVVRQMTQEQLSADSWAWRKYGQKPIKGSPYPRNYYRCSTSKVCAARKQLERSPNDPGLFIVSYTGEHIHPRPTHRSSLAGSTRAKSSISAAAAVIATNSNIDDNEILSRNKGLNSSSLTSTICSPTIRPVASIKDEEEDDNDDDVFKEFDDHSSCDGNLFPIITSPP